MNHKLNAGTFALAVLAVAIGFNISPRQEAHRSLAQKIQHVDEGSIAEFRHELNALKERLRLAEQSNIELQDGHTQTNVPPTNTENFERLDRLASLVDQLQSRIEQQNNAASDQPLSAESQYSMEQQLQQQEQLRVNNEALYSQTFDTQELDPNWSAGAEQDTWQALYSASNVILARELECRNTLCRLDFARPEGIEDNDTLDAFDMNIKWEGEMYMTYNPKTGEGFAYLSRPGHPLPRLEQSDS